MASAVSAVNYWPDSACAKAFWGQHVMLPYQQLLADTVAWLEPMPEERWLDLGCGSGQLSKALWQSGGGALAEVVGLDCAAVNDAAFVKLRARLQPAPSEGTLYFVPANFSDGLAAWPDERFHGIVSGLAIQYAESYSESEERWTTAAYDRVLTEAHRLLAPGGRFVFSVNVPEPSWGRVLAKSLLGAFRHKNPLRSLRQLLNLARVYRMWSYGGWLKREARKGRFHYLSAAVICDKLQSAGFTNIEHRRSFAGQAHLFRAWKPASAASFGDFRIGRNEEVPRPTATGQFEPYRQCCPE